MRKAPVSPAITAMIEPALNWLEAHRITGLRTTKNAEGKTDYVADATSEEVYWARFYDVQTAKPMFAGAQAYLNYYAKVKQNHIYRTMLSFIHHL